MQTEASDTYIVAMDLAVEMAAAVKAKGPHRKALISAALDVGTWLAGQGRPGRWDTIDAADVLRICSFSTETQNNGFLLSLAGLVGYAAFHEYITARESRRILMEIERLATNGVVKSFAAQTAGQMGRIMG
jgi:hypothetical protein